jgi:hypothetical protein
MACKPRRSTSEASLFIQYLCQNTQTLSIFRIYDLYSTQSLQHIWGVSKYYTCDMTSSNSFTRALSLLTTNLRFTFSHLTKTEQSHCAVTAASLLCSFYTTDFRWNDMERILWLRIANTWDLIVFQDQIEFIAFITIIFIYYLPLFAVFMF